MKQQAVRHVHLYHHQSCNDAAQLLHSIRRHVHCVSAPVAIPFTNITHHVIVEQLLEDCIHGRIIAVIIGVSMVHWSSVLDCNSVVHCNQFVQFDLLGFQAPFYLFFIRVRFSMACRVCNPSSCNTCLLLIWKAVAILPLPVRSGLV